MYDEVAQGMELVGHSDLGGRGATMGIQVVDGIAYVGHMGTDGASTSVVDVRDPSQPRLIRQLEPPPGTRSHKVQAVGNTLIVNCERNPWGGADGGPSESWTGGLKVYDISDRTDPVEVGFLPFPGKGVHRMSFTEGHLAYMSASDDGFSDQFLAVVDLSDPSAPVEAGRWWMPGMREGETPTWSDDRHAKLHHALIRGDRAYAGWWDLGVVILDISDLDDIRLVSHLPLGDEVSKNTHTVMPMPGRDVLIVTDEALADRCQELQKVARVVDISDETAPAVVATLPIPQGDYCDRGGRFGPHNVHEMRPGSFRSDSIVHMTYFNAGVRVFDVTDASAPQEVASYVPAHDDADGPPPQLNDIFVDADELVYVTERYRQGLFILRRTT